MNNKIVENVGVAKRRWLIRLNSSERYRSVMVYGIVCILSIFAFISIYGIYVLNPTYTDWLLSDLDLSQHYTGWAGYRNSQWMFPIGMHDSLTYPESVSIIFSDSIPIFAVLFKILSPLLPEHFQYFGLWGIMSFALQGMIAAKCLRVFIKNSVAVIFASQLFVYAPVMIARMYTHTALAGQWVVLFGVYMLLNYRIYAANAKKRMVYLCVMGLLSSTVHIYFLLMNGIVLLGICLRDWMERKCIARCFEMLMIYVVSAAFFIWILGGFTGASDAAGEALGYYSFNLNGLFNPQGWSYYMRDLPVIQNNGEGLAFLGFGCIVLLIIALVLFFNATSCMAAFKRNKSIILPLILITSIAAVVAASPTITFNDSQLLTYPVPKIIYKLWSIFRASGRFAWLIVYIVILCSCILVYQYLNRRMLIAVICFCVLLQVSDLHIKLENLNARFDTDSTVYHSLLQDKTFWSTIAENDTIKHIVLTNPEQSNDTLLTFADLTTKSHKTINNFYLARVQYDMEKNVSEALANISDEYLYVFLDDKIFDCDKYNLHYYNIDNMIIGYSQEIEGFSEMDYKEMTAKISYRDNEFLSTDGGQDTENGRVIYPGGLSYGPYWDLAKNNYTITILGSGFSESTTISVTSDSGLNKHEFQIAGFSNDRIDICLSLHENANDVELLVQNGGTENIILNEAQVKVIQTE